MDFAQIENDEIYYIFYDVDKCPAMPKTVQLVDITDITPQPAVGWLYDGKVFTEPQEPEPAQSESEILLEECKTLAAEGSTESMLTALCKFNGLL